MKRLILTLAVLLSLSLSGMAQRTELYGQRASLFDVLPVDSTNIVFLGNSLIHGGEWQELLNNPKIVNRGINGDTADGIDERLGSILRGKPAKIFLITGANDISHNLTADSIATMIGGLIDRIHTESPATRVYLHSVLPFNTTFGRYRLLDGKEEVVPQLNALLEPLAAEKNATFINLYPHFVDENGRLREELTNDGLHLLGQGYLIWAEIDRPYVEE